MKKQRKTLGFSQHSLFFALGFGALFLLTRLLALTLLPVFADESIYIRWSQLIIDDWQQYLFFPLNDGKTPLFVWLMVPVLGLIKDPLFAGRLVAVGAGLVQLVVARKLIKELGGKQTAITAVSWAVLILPFWYFHHRMALMDGLLTALLSVSWFFLLKAYNTQKNNAWLFVGSGVAFGLALLTKLPALLFLPALCLTPWLASQKKPRRWKAIAKTALPIFIGLLIFLSLKIHPAFSQLFNRGGDFLYSFSELLQRGLWPGILRNGKLVLSTFITYLTWPCVILPFAGLFIEGSRKKHALLILSSLAFVAPILVLGKTVYPRYMLPVAVPLTLSAALVFEYWYTRTQQLIRKPVRFFISSAALIAVASVIFTTAFQFMLISWKNPDFLPYVSADRVQYAAEWSSGHGIRETTVLIQEEAKTTPIAVATEGYFGTLPDGILMYLHNQDVSNILVEGIGQPVTMIPDSFIQKAQSYKKVWLVVNSHREKMGLNANRRELLVREFCRINNAPCLQVWDITTLVRVPAGP